MAEGTLSQVIPQEKEANKHFIALVAQEMESRGGDFTSNSIPVIQQEFEPNGDEIRRNSIPVIQQEFEPNGDEIRRNSIPAIQKEIESDSDDFRRAFIPMISQEVGSNADESDDISTKSISVIRQEVESNADESDDISTKSISVIRQEVESNVDESNDVSTKSIPVITQEMELEGSDIGRNFTPQELELRGDGEIDPADIQTNSIPVILQEMEFNGGDVGRNPIAGIPLEMEHEGGDIRRNSIIVIPVGIEATGADVRRRSIARSIQSRYLRASMGSCHDFCKYGLKKACEDENLEASPRADRKRTSTVNSKPSPHSVVMEKRIISVTKKGTTFPKKVSLQEVSSPFKEVDVPTEREFEPSSKVKSPVGHEPSLDFETQILNKSFVTEEKVASVTEKGTVDVTMEDSMDLEEPEQLEPSSFPVSVRSLRNSKVISTISPRPSPGSATNKKPKEMEISTEDPIDSKVKPQKSKPSSLAGSMQSMMNSKVASKTSFKPSKDSETRKLNSSAIMEKKVTTVKKEGTASSNNRSIGTRKSKEAPDSSSNRSIRKHTGRASLPGEKRTMGLQTVSLSFKHFNKRDSNMNTGSSYNLKGLSHVKEDQNDPEKVEPQSPRDKDMPEKILYVIESSTENSTMESTPKDLSVPKPSPSSAAQGKSKSLKHARKGIGRTGSSPSSEKKNLKRVNGAESRSAGPLDQDNKGLRRTRRGTQASLSPSSSSSSLSISSSKSTQHKENGANSQHDISKTVKPVGQSKVHHKTPRKSPIVGSGNRSSVPHKLTFRRGRVVELQHENSTPRRLKFRRVRLAVEVQNSKGSFTGGSIERKEVDDSQSTTSSGIIKRGSNVRKEVGNREINGDGIKRASIVKKEVGDRQPNGVSIKRGIIGRKEVDDDQTNGAQVKSEKVVLRHQEQVKFSPGKSLRRKGVSGDLLNDIRSNEEKVVLRHQDVDGKKDDQKLFNNVIEETASKLAETRKSKVKALVGAFETVISLQDRKLAAADAC